MLCFSSIHRLLSPSTRPILVELGFFVSQPIAPLSLETEVLRGVKLSAEAGGLEDVTPFISRSPDFSRPLGP